MQMLWQSPFFACLLLRLKLDKADHLPEITSMATDGKNLFYNTNFVDRMTF